MGVWTISGGKKLNGQLRGQGSKNAVLPIMAATIISGSETEIENCPELSDVTAAMDILRHLGCRAERRGDMVYVDSRGMNRTDIPEGLMHEMRSSVIFLGAILARAHMATISYPGGCELGKRPVDLHLSALRSLGAEIEEQGCNINCTDKGLVGTEINLRFPSVGATENTMLAACAAKGRTVITNAAREPEIVDLQEFMRKLGANISGAGTSTVTIDGFEPQKNIRHRVMSDRIVSSTAMCCVAAAGGCLTLNEVEPEDFETVTAALEYMGCDIERGEHTIRLKCERALRACYSIETKPYPAFPTDAQPLLMAVCITAAGETVFTENIFENRYRHVPELCRLGAEISLEDRIARVSGVKRLVGTNVSATDLRGGAALVTAALSAEGKTVISDSGHITRGYENLDKMLGSLGAELRYESN